MPKQLELPDGNTVLVSNIDYDFLNQFPWFVNSNGYVIRSGDYIPFMERMHRIVMSRMIGRELCRCEFVDHDNGNKLDNRRSKLRLATNSQNQFNRARNVNHRNGSGYKGVYPTNSQVNPWMARITVNRKSLYLGSFPTPEEAARAYDEKAFEIAGIFAQINLGESNV